MDSDANCTMEVAALGRPFSLGMLYDCRKDSLVPGLTLWDHDDLVKHIRERPQKHNDFEIVTSELIEDKSSALDVNASLKASFLGGLVQVNGSAKYLNNSKTSKNQARVTLKYKATTKVQELSMNHLGRGNVKHPYVFDKGLATHIVTGILYGAQAFFVFDREVSQNENQQNVEGNLKLVIKKIPFLAIEGEGSLKMEEKDRVNVEKFSCSFIGDFSLQKMPTSFEDAIQVYQSLPSLLGANGENSVPMKVWLLPLTTLDSSAAKLVRQISVSLVQESQKVLEDFIELEMRCNDALRTTTAQQFPQIEKKIKTFKEMCSEFKLEFQQALAKKLPSIRGGGEEEAGLAEILSKIHSSPFSNRNLNEWMNCKIREIMALKRFTNMMKNTTVVSAQHADEEIFSSDHCVCFVFTSLGVDEPFLSVLSNYLRQKPESENPGDPRTHDVEREQWYSSKEVVDSLRTKAKLFSDFAEANQENVNMKFLTVGMTNQTQKGSSVYLYKDGFPVTEDFEPPSKPETFTDSDVNHNSVKLKFDPPKFGSENITSYSVEYCVSGEEGWKQQTAEKSGEITVADLSPNTEYMFRCRAVTDVGVGPANQISSPIKTLPCSPPGKPQVQSNSTEVSVSWEKPAEIGKDVHNLSYIMEYTKTDTEEDLQWNQKKTGAEEMIISGLQPETEYALRVRSDCGAAGRSKESVTVKVSTTEYNHLTEQFKQRSTRINNTSPSVYKLTLEKQRMSIKGCRWFNLGKESMKPNLTIMLMGATRSGKSTLIDGMINYIVGVNWKDDFRFKMIEENESRSQSESQTSEVTVYKVNHQEGFRIDHSLTIVDAPDFGDTRDIERDREIREMLRNLFSESSGLSDIHAVCLVVQSSLAQLTPTEEHVFHSVLSIFGKDITENLRVLVTFADGQVPPVLKVINDSGVPCPKTEDGQPVHFKFNNSALFADNTSSADGMNFDEMFWNMGTGSMERFFVALNLIDAKSLTMTEEVLRERQQLENPVEKLQEQVKISLAKLEEIKETEEKLKEFEAEIKRNENFEIEVTVTKPVQVELTKAGSYFFNCQQCHFTCHDNRPSKDDKNKIRCSVIRSDGYCTVCPGKCFWNVHFNQAYKWEYKQVKVKQTIAELKKKYDIAKKDKSPIEALFGKLRAEYESVKTTVKDLIRSSDQCPTRLREISLKPDPLSTTEYIDMLIEGEKSEAKPGWKKRVQSLMDLRERAELMAKVGKGEAPHSSLA
ncbi:uncharacterized protein LOC121520703 isoform X2 [Cheilinus undulatus]|nr:uncharacterized protein LOC121520703 isoform X2 [Cheilinus undulatus]XP_041660216.1 uncharacterized protein LOC121520703 isoform X2 [Cheilinus undulatus]XP_041660217.1 uncharacterized protein LOC121520703 isoform X2 [Cheilinus undulatus]